MPGQRLDGCLHPGANSAGNEGIRLIETAFGRMEQRILKKHFN
jgi:hypothetical protein